MRFATAQGFNSGDQFYAYLRDSFDTLYAEGADNPKMMSVGLHCRLAGRPGRAAALDRFPRLCRRARRGLGGPAHRTLPTTGTRTTNPHEPAPERALELPRISGQ